jgi:6-pyruvoyltetrahydropterin/6-carboxytetrahydropterin synthase
MYEVTVRGTFSAAHHLWGYTGECSRQHGHNWEVELSLQCSQLDARGLSIDFHRAREALDEVLGELDHRDLNTLEAFQEGNPTSENIARHIYFQVATRFPELQVARVTIHESATSSVSFWK